MDFYAQVPKTLKENLAYRVRLRERARKDPKFRKALLTACKHDFLFFLAAFCWGYDPRPQVGQPKWTPFIPRAHQVEPLKIMRANLGYGDIHVKKSRDEGMTWMVVYLALHDWLFDPGSKVGIMSRNEDEADDPDNSDSIFWKIDHGLAKLPKWMAGERDRDWTRNRSKHSLVNKRNGEAQINADAATGNAFRGGRHKWIAKDEFAFFKPGEDGLAMASSGSATYSRLFFSTVNGTDNEFHSLDVTPSDIIRIVIHWSDNPIKNRGLYKFKDGKPVAVDPVNNPLQPDYNPPTENVLKMFKELRERGFELEGRLRSPWYDGQCHRGGQTPQRIAQELDHDYGGSMSRIFLSEFFSAAERTVRKPTITGRLTYNPETLEPEFEAAPNESCLLWLPLDVNGRPPMREYVIGADISQGGGGSYTSNSVAQVIDTLTLEQVFEYATPSMEPADFADWCIALSKWFYDAFLGWEHNGPGTAFTKQIKVRNYGNVYRREIHHKGGGAKKTTDLGWWTDVKSKEVMFSMLSKSVRSRELILHSSELVRECGQYVRLKGRITHVANLRVDGHTGGNEAAHGDRVMALGVAQQAARQRNLHAFEPGAGKKVSEQRLADNPPKGTMAYRMKELQDAESRERDDWDSRSNWDFQRGVHDLRPIEHW